MSDPGRGILVTGTDTGIGKTFVSVLILRQLAEKGISATALKPVASGCDRTRHGLRNADTLQLIEASGVPLEYLHANRYAFEPPISPHIAAAQNGVNIRLDMIRHDLDRARQLSDYVVVEGVGGWRVPLSQEFDLAGLATELALPVLLVVGIRLGCINHALLTSDSIYRSGLTLRGWVANHYEGTGASGGDTIAAIADRIDAPLLGNIPYCSEGMQAGDRLPDLAAGLLSN